MSLAHASRYYGAVFLALLLLLTTTVVAARHDLGSWNWPIAAAIALGKTFLVAACFMHLRNSEPLVRLVAIVGLFWLMILLGLTATDFQTRAL